MTDLNRDFMPPADPWRLFAEWYDLAQEKESAYPNAMTLATLGADGMPSARTVLMKSFSKEGVVFFTNRESRKGRQLTAHPKAALCFYWKSLQRQVHFEGAVTLLDDAASDAYFASRPRGHQIGAWASLQSRGLASRDALERRVQRYEQQYADQPVPRPPHWGGFVLQPRSIEFWQERLYRLHDRLRYYAEDMKADWEIEKLYP